MAFISVKVKDRHGENHEVDSQPGQESLMQVLFDAGQDIEAVCGGCCSCATCHVYVDSEWLSRVPERSDDEEMLLEHSDHFDELRSRLCCQLKISDELDGISLELAPED